MKQTKSYISKKLYLKKNEKVIFVKNYIEGANNILSKYYIYKKLYYKNIFPK